MVTINDAYELLNLPIGASKDKVLTNYRSLALKWHPDKNKQSSESFEKFKKICSAFYRISIHDQEYANDLSMEQMFEIFQDAFLLHKSNGCCSYNSSSEDDLDDDFDRYDEENSDDNSEVKPAEKRLLMPVSSEVAKKNAEELLAEEEKEKKKAEKRRARKKRRKQKKKQEKELPQEHESNKEVNTQPDAQGLENSKNSSCDETESEEEWDPKSAFVATVANKSKVSNYIYNNKTEKETYNDAKELSKDIGLKEDENDPTILRSRIMAIRANEIASLGKLEEAIELFSEAIKMNPKDFRFYGNRSYCYEKIKLYDRALKDAEKAISLNANWPKNYYRKGRALAGLMKFAEAEQAFEKVLSLDEKCKDAEQELLHIRATKLIEMGFTRQQAYSGIKKYGNVEKVVEAMSQSTVNIHTAGYEGDTLISDEEDLLLSQYNIATLADIKMDPSNPEGISTLWVGNISRDITEKNLRQLFGQYGVLSSLRIIPEKFCAFINYESKASASKAMKALQGTMCGGQKLLIKFPDNPANSANGSNKKIVNPIGSVSSKQTGPVNNNECYFWRTTGCSYGDNCRYKHLKEHKGIDKKGWHKM